MDNDFGLDWLISSIADFTEDAILVTEAEPIDDPGPRIVWCNAAFTRMSGYELKEVVGRSPRLLQGPDPDRKELDRLRRGLENWEAVRVELKNYKKDGTPFWVEFIVRPVADPSGHYRYWVSVQRETTDRREREQLLESTQRMLDNAPVGLGLLNSEMQLTYVNAALESELFANTSPPLLPFVLRSWLLRAAESAGLGDPNAAKKWTDLTLKGLLSTPFRIDQPLGSKWLAFRRVPLPDGSSLLIVDDITEQHDLQSELDFNLRIESMGQLAGGVAHDFNNLLAVMLGSLEVAAEEDDKADRNELISDAISSIMTSREIVKQLLAFSRKSPSVRTETSVVDFCRHFEKLARLAIPDHVSLSFDYEVVDCKMLVDTAQFEAALLNVLLNAKDAIVETGEIIFSVRLEKDDECVVFSIKDNGRGIPRPALRRVIEPFYTSKESGQGTGLGLAMVHGFVQQAGGLMVIESEVGAGTNVQISLPASVSDRKLREIVDAGNARLPESANVLIVEDDPGVRKVIKLFLRDLKWSVAEAEDGDAAAKIIEAGSKFDLVITDLSMPGRIQGIDLADMLNARAQETSVIVITGNPGAMQDCSKRYPHILKPIRRAEFLDAIADVMVKASPV